MIANRNARIILGVIFIVLLATPFAIKRMSAAPHR